MPSTVNGIGTHYYGKKNVLVRSATCQQCGRATQLTSYDTRLWFVLVFIPIIPLGRKRIVDCCPACTRHYAIDLDKWETTKQLEISGALEKYRSDPSPDSAIAAHQQLLNYHQAEQAAEFRQLMLGKYADNARVQAYLGFVLEEQGQWQEAEACFSRALALRADLPEARVGVAMSHLRAQRLDEARQLLDFLEKPGAAQLYSLAPLETLAIAFQNANRHTEALQLLGKLQEALPNIAEVKGFRDLVKKSEKAVASRESILPKQKFSWRRLLGAGDRPVAAPTSTRVTWRGVALVGIVLGVVLLGLAITNEYIRRHRTVHLVNGFPQRATVEIQGAEPVRQFLGQRAIVLPEGRHRARISGPVQEEVDFELRSGYFDRWFSDPAWVLNVGSAAVLVMTEAVYSENPEPGSSTFRFGRPFEHFSRVTHPFTSLPESLQMKKHERRTLVELELYRGEGLPLFNHLVHQQRQPEEALRFAESWLKAHPDDEALLRLYVFTAHQQKQDERVEAFLKPGLGAQPIRIEWHRSYQGLRKKPEQRVSLRADYDRWLSGDPTNSALLYLRGRLAESPAEGDRFFEQAVASDAGNPYPVFALGYGRMMAADWLGARPLLARAVELAPEDEAFAHWFNITRLALGETNALESESLSKLKREPLDYRAEVLLQEVLSAEGRVSDALSALTNYTRAFKTKYPDSDLDLLNPLCQQVLYAVGDFAGLEKAASADRSKAGTDTRIVALIEQGRLAEAVGLASPAVDPGDGLTLALAFSVAFHHAGDLPAAARWRETALQAMQQADTDLAQAAILLESSTPPPVAEVTSLVMSLNLKAAFVTVLAQKHPPAAAELTGLARKLNVERGFPYHLVQRATASPHR